MTDAVRQTQTATLAMMDPSGTAPSTRPLRILHVLAISEPHLNGYAVRSSSIIDAQRAAGLDPIAVTSPFYPGNPATVRDTIIRGTRYLRIPHPVDLERCRHRSDRRARRYHRLRKRGREVEHRLRTTLRSTRQVVRDWRQATRAPPQQPGDGWPRLRDLPVLLRNLAGALASLLMAALKIAAALVSPLVRVLAHGVARLLAGASSAPDASPALSAEGVAGMRVKGRLDRLASALRAREDALLLARTERELERLCRELQPDLLHVHSPYRNAVPALAVGRRLGLPVVYEVRGLWEDSGTASGNFREGDAAYEHWRTQEIASQRGADAVVCICEQLRQESILRGVPPERVFVVPNAVDPDLLAEPPEITDPEARQQLAQVRARLRYPTLGYVGSIRALEGVAELVRGAGELVRRGTPVSLLVVGDGPGRADLEKLAERLGLGENAVFTGRVPHDLVPHYYRAIDVFVVSRPDLRVCRMVTPLKPLEAMVLGCALVVSDLPALRELVQDGHGLAYRPGDVDHLATQCARLLGDARERAALAAAARAWVVSERTWERVVRAYEPAYRQALATCDARTESPTLAASAP